MREELGFAFSISCLFSSNTLRKPEKCCAALQDSRYSFIVKRIHGFGLVRRRYDVQSICIHCQQQTFLIMPYCFHFSHCLSPPKVLLLLFFFYCSFSFTAIQRSTVALSPSLQWRRLIACVILSCLFNSFVEEYYLFVLNVFIFCLSFL